jgi:hypothetical protein
MTTLAETREGLAACIDTIDGLRVYNLIPDDANYPAATIDLTEIEYSSLNIEGARRALFTIALFVPRTDARQQLKLYDLIDNGPGSIFAAVLADRKLGGLDVNANPVGGSVALDTNQIGLTHLYGRAVNVNVFVS